MRHSEKNSMDKGLTIVQYKNIMHANLAYTMPIYLGIVTTTRSPNIVKCSQLLVHAIFLPLNKFTAIRDKA